MSYLFDNTQGYNDEILREMLNSRYSLTFKELDDILVETGMPMDISKIIYEYQRPTCKECDECCDLCRFFCFYGCLKIERNNCCKWEFNNENRKYNLSKELEIVDTISILIEDVENSI